MLFFIRIDEFMIFDNFMLDVCSVLKFYFNFVIWVMFCVCEFLFFWFVVLCGLLRFDEMNSSWFQKFKGIIVLIVGGVVGVVGGCGGFWWVGVGGIFVKGFWGMYLVVGYFNMVVVGGIVIGVGGVVFVIGVMVYFVFWDRVFEYFGYMMKWIWVWICDGFQWIWKKVMEFVSEVVICVLIRKMKKYYQLLWVWYEIQVSSKWGGCLVLCVCVCVVR